MAPFLQKMHRSPTMLNAARFAAVGALGTTLDFTLFFAAQMFFHLPALAANTLSYSAGIVNNYCLHRAWTFAARPRKAARGQFALFAAVSLVALVINSLVVLALKPLFTQLLPDPTLAAALAKIAATAAGILWNFFANHAWTFGG